MSQIPNTTAVKIGHRIHPLTRPVCGYTARRIERILPQLLALNTAGKSQPDAAAALGITSMSLRNYCALLNVSWSNLNRRTNA
jgi:hypothetical protein